MSISFFKKMKLICVVHLYLCERIYTYCMCTFGCVYVYYNMISLLMHFDSSVGSALQCWNRLMLIFSQEFVVWLDDEREGKVVRPGHVKTPPLSLSLSLSLSGEVSVNAHQHLAAQMLLHCLQHQSPDQTNWELLLISYCLCVSDEAFDECSS